MSILIKGMEMPKTCWDCACSIYYESQDKAMCDITDETLDYILWKRERRPDCPLIELPPHGRLIDADKLSNQKYENIWTNRLVIDADDLDDASTVIEAERENI